MAFRPMARTTGPHRASLRPELFPGETGPLFVFGHVAENAARDPGAAELLQVAPVIDGLFACDDFPQSRVLGRQLVLGKPVEQLFQFLASGHG